MKSDDLNFLMDLNRKTTEKVTYTMTPNISRIPYTVEGYEYTEYQLTKPEITRILDIVKHNNDVVFTPIQGSFGFHPAFAAVLADQPHPDAPLDIQYVLRFDRDQYPGDAWSELEPHFTDPENIRLIGYYGLPSIMYRSYYEY